MLNKTKEDLKKIDQVFKPPQTVASGSSTYGESSRFDNLSGFQRLIEKVNKNLI